jgi:hypothetical protein
LHINGKRFFFLFLLLSLLFLQGGVFIMEPQPWTSYRRNRLVSEVGSFDTD